MSDYPEALDGLRTWVQASVDATNADAAQPGLLQELNRLGDFLESQLIYAPGPTETPESLDGALAALGEVSRYVLTKVDEVLLTRALTPEEEAAGKCLAENFVQVHVRMLGFRVALKRFSRGQFNKNSN